MEIASDVVLNYMSRLDELRELDSIIDFARGSVQLRIMLTLANGRNGLTAKEIATVSRCRYKAVLDALRKLVAKGLVVKEGNGSSDIYKLSESGEEFLSKLLKLLPAQGYDMERRRSSRKVLIYDFVNGINVHHYVAEALIAIGTSRDGEVSLGKIAEAMKLSRDRAKTYLDMYSDKNSLIRLFKRVERESRFKRLLSKLLNKLGVDVKIGVTNIYYMLTDNGMTVFYKHPYYIKYRRSKSARIATIFVGSAHPRIVARFAARIALAVLAVSSIASLLYPHIASILYATSAAITSIFLALIHNVS